MDQAATSLALILIWGPTGGFLAGMLWIIIDTIREGRHGL